MELTKRPHTSDLDEWLHISHRPQALKTRIRKTAPSSLLDTYVNLYLAYQYVELYREHAEKGGRVKAVEKWENEQSHITNVLLPIETALKLFLTKMDFDDDIHG